MIRCFRLSLALLFVVSLNAAACGKKKIAPPPQPPPAPAPAETPRATPTPPPPPPPTSAPRPADPRPPTEEEIFGRMSVAELNATKPLTDAFFAYDSTELNEASRAALQKDSEWMKKWTTTKVVIEGHADNRGTNEYNLALGDRRADAVRDYLVGLGISTDRITVVSKGEEQPFCSEDTESCWQENRRGHFIITAK